MKKLSTKLKKIDLIPLVVFLVSLLVYYWVGTDGGLGPRPDLDHFNPLAQSFRQGRLDIHGAADQYDLSFYQGRYYPYWGPLPALILVPLQVLLGGPCSDDLF